MFLLSLHSLPCKVSIAAVFEIISFLNGCFWLILYKRLCFPCRVTEVTDSNAVCADDEFHAFFSFYKAADNLDCINWNIWQYA